MKKVVAGLILIFMYHLSGLAQTGKIAGKVTSADTGKGLDGVAVFLEDSQTGTYTQSNGTYILKDIPAGNHTVHARFIGYQTQSSPVNVADDETVLVNFVLEIDKIRIEGIGVNATRAIKRETPIAFTDISQEVISDKYTTDDIPQLLVNVPGLFASSTGIGEAEITMRGFDADKIQVLINGIPVNDPESQKVYWSNWTGLSSNVKSVQVQRGAGSSLYGSGAFGGSLNIETIGSTPDREFSVRSSFGGFLTEEDVADGKGNISSYNPYNYNVVFRYNSGNLYRGKFNYNLMLERKAGDSYITGTNYDGYSFGVEAQSVLHHHTLNFSFIGAPQEHNQVYFKSDRNLMKTLGREYNRNNHPYQENYYFKPQISLRDKWEISEEQLLMTNLFFTKGDGGGKYLNQDKFDVNTGRLHYRDDFLDQNNPAAFENNLFGKHALYLYQTYGVLMAD
ncbi:MAG: TonB-dependent receptor, partial [Candidatus Cloacimonetes bacterium]|nr:TonB-dependent receptor [Candidatus Cloacimonadota bacterium]